MDNKMRGLVALAAMMLFGLGACGANRLIPGHLIGYVCLVCTWVSATLSLTFLVDAIVKGGKNDG